MNKNPQDSTITYLSERDERQIEGKKWSRVIKKNYPNLCSHSDIRTAVPGAECHTITPPCTGNNIVSMGSYYINTSTSV